MAKRRQYKFVGLAYMRPCGRGINVQGRPDQEPYEALDEQICAALGLDSGSFYIEVVARPKPPKGYKPRPAPTGPTKLCTACGGKMGVIDDVMGSMWSCRTCGHSESMDPEIGVHMRHCNRGENLGGCKYGEIDDCPALKRGEI